MLMEQKNIKLGNNLLNYTLRISPRARHLRLTVHPRDGLLVTVPRRMSLKLAENFIKQKSSWIISKLDYIKNHPLAKFTPEKKEQERIDYIHHKELARILVKKRLEYFNQFYNFKFGRISIRNQKTRWGSCSRAGNLNFNYKISRLPQNLADYVVVHELCHLRELNHSPRFWSLVAQTIPDYLKIRKELRYSERTLS
jgi:predicted metal-dependent hydrolase